MPSLPRRSVVVATVAVLITASTLAQSAQRPDVTQMSCQQAQQLIQDAGAVVVTTGPRTYKRFVADERFCDAGENDLHPAYTNTADKESCRIAYTCESWNLYFTDRD